MIREVLNSYRLSPGLTTKETISNWASSCTGVIWDVFNSYRLSPRLTTKEIISNKCSERRRRTDGQVTVITMTSTVENSRGRTRLTVGTLIWREPMLREVQLAADWPGDVGQLVHLGGGSYLA